MNPASYTRREFLQQLVYWVAIGGTAGCRALPQAASGREDFRAGWLEDSVGSLDSAARIGRLYLDAYPEEQNADRLVDSVMSALPGKPDFDAVTGAIKRDYVRGETVLVDRWVISRTEARVYALVAIYHTEFADGTR